jgi:tRNA modification GTPase
LEEAERLVTGDARWELAAEELREAAATLGEIVGEATVDHILDVIFSRFCVGK